MRLYPHIYLLFNNFHLEYQYGNTIEQKHLFG